MRGKDAYLKEIEETESYARILAKGYSYTAIAWGKVNLSIGVPNTIIAAIAGASALSNFSNSNIVAGILSIIVSVLSGLLTFLNPSDRAKSHMQAFTEFQRLCQRLNMMKIDLANEDGGVISDELRRKIEDMFEKLHDLRSVSPMIPVWAYKVAKSEVEKNIIY
jgi:hypothetical protein